MSANRGIAAIVAVALVALAVVTVATPAYAGCLAGPDHGDGRIRRGSGNYHGAGTYNCDGTDQTVSRTVGAGVKKTFDVRYENDCTQTFDVTLRGQELGDIADFKVKVRRPDKGNKNVTQKFFNNGVVYKAIPIDMSTPRLRIVVKGLETAEPGDEVSVQVRGQLDGEGSSLWDTVVAMAGA